MPDGWTDAYRRWVDAGWNTLAFPPHLGGGGLPFTVEYAVSELFSADNVAFAISSLLTRAAAELLATWARPETPAPGWVPKLVTGEWAGTMNLTEPEAGSDVGALRTRAIEQPDGTYKIVGTKIFITFGDHDMTDNIVHLVLARRDGAAAGTAGISCFAVPKYLANEGRQTRNDVTIISIERKVGIHATPTCVISYGDNGGATGWLVGETEQGLRCMFTMMNAARLPTASCRRATCAGVRPA
jgi:alkylation response protein AidB-like acyl-CoA dehydrogenase